MSLQFIRGGGQLNHQQEMLSIAKQWLLEPQKDVFFLVPNYNKFEREQEILFQLKQLQGTKNFTSIKSQVYSFHRLAWYFLQRTGASTGKNISETGASLIMRRVVENMKEQLIIFRGESNKSGFIQHLVELYSEFQSGNIDSTTLNIREGESLSERDAFKKITEIRMIFLAYEQELVARDIQLEQPIAKLTEYLSNESNSQSSIPDLSRSLFIVSGFSNFSAQEQALLSVLMRDSHLCVDLLVENPTSDLDTLDLFYEPKKTYQELRAVARQQNVPVLLDRVPKEKPTVARGYLSVESSWRDPKFSDEEPTTQEFVHLWKTDTPEEELRQIAFEIRKLVSATAATSTPIRYRDIQLLTLSPETYYGLLPTVFRELEIPYYLDEDKKMEQHPLVEFVQSLFALKKYHYRIADVFRFLRTELYIPVEIIQEDAMEKSILAYRERVDLTENIALSHQFQGSDWSKEADWQLIGLPDDKGEEVSIEVRSNELRRALKRDIGTLFQQLDTAVTNLDAVQVFYHFLVQSGIEKQLLVWRDRELERGLLEAARNHEQTWLALMDLFDEFTTIYGDDPFSYDLFEEVFSKGLEHVSFGKIPTAIDIVKINQLDLARPLQAKVTFAIGLTETTFPRKVENHSLLSVEERAHLNSQLLSTQFLRDKVNQTVRNEPFVFYNLLLSASEKLYLTYPITNDTQTNSKPSSYLKRLQRQLSIQVTALQKLNLTSDPCAYVGSYRGLIRQLNNLYRQAIQEQLPLPPMWTALRKQLNDSDLASLAEHIFSSQSYQNQPVSLSSETAKALYGEEIYSSVSRMETFYQCEFKYFADFGLRLQERDIYGLNSAVTGEFFHDALDQFLSLLITEKISLLAISDEVRQDLVNKVLIRIFGEIRYSLLNRTARMNFIRYQLSQTIQRVTWAMKKQSERSKLSPIQTEVLFGQIAGNVGISGLELPLNHNSKLHIRGKIDRVDLAMVDGQPFISVIDYKSSSREFDLIDAYYGLAMQLITYLDVALNDAVELIGRKDVKLAGAYYMHVHDPILTQEDFSEKKRLEQFQFDGLFLDDPNVFSIYDNQLEAKERSVVFPIKKDKDDQFQISKGPSKFFKEDEIELLREYNQQNMIDSGNQILKGSVQLNPTYKLKDKKRACQFCTFRSVCSFDAMLPKNNYRRIESLSKDNVMQSMKKKLGKPSKNENEKEEVEEKDDE